MSQQRSVGVMCVKYKYMKVSVEQFFMQWKYSSTLERGNS